MQVLDVHELVDGLIAFAESDQMAMRLIKKPNETVAKTRRCEGTPPAAISSPDRTYNLQGFSPGFDVINRRLRLDNG